MCIRRVNLRRIHRDEGGAVVRGASVGGQRDERQELSCRINGGILMGMQGGSISICRDNLKPVVIMMVID